jgi:hypothetical protein
VALVRKEPPLVGEVSAKRLRKEGVVWSAQQIPTAVNLDFLYPEPVTFPFKWAAFQNRYFSENLVVPVIEPGTSESVARNSDHYTTDTVC